MAAAPHIEGIGLPAPHNIDAERALLGSLLLEPGIFPTVMHVKAEDFYHPGHQIAFREIRALIEAGGTADLTAVTDRIGNRGELDACGGYIYLANLEQFVLSTSAAPEHAAIIREKATLRRLIATAQDVIRRAVDAQSSEEIVPAAQQAIYDATQAHDRRGPRSWATVMPEVAESVRITCERARAGEVIGISSGLTDLDRLIGGFEVGLHILAARTSIGKTAFALDLQRKLCREGHCVPYFSLEMGNLAIGTRAACAEAGISADKCRRGMLANWELSRLDEAAETLAGFPGIYSDRSSLTAAEFAVEARMIALQRAATESPVGMFIVDGLWLMDHPRIEGGNLAARIAETTKRMARVANELEIPVLLLHQLNRGSESRSHGATAKKSLRPMLSDLRESGAVEQDAQTVLLLHRERVEREGEDLAPERLDQRAALIPTDVIVAKHRNGPTGTVTVGFQPELQRFVDFAGERGKW